MRALARLSLREIIKPRYVDILTTIDTISAVVAYLVRMFLL